ncbi:histone-lysine N-methyltransferase SETMAR [Trichonephila inaurata madagascariensis]|uniref:Histone-lysine N-methyltransferase SETMAR n=1 Tax=Trichonephila inaurata madagascariensis TaxID=2747483 RepID=A0A8X7C238_9ARAC|nr:histone-lysine N-methyltransferase SETMAR [Trichonephila inaurata madagascariensis]
MRNRQSRVGISVGINAGPLLTFINRSSYSSEVKWTYRRNSFGVVYFTTSKWTYQPLHQIAEYVKHFGIVQAMNVRETVRLPLHRLGKTYRLSKWIPHTLLEVLKQQGVAACLSLLSLYRSASIFNRVLTSDEKWVLYDTPKRSKYWLSPQDTVPHSAIQPMHPSRIMLCV